MYMGLLHRHEHYLGSKSADIVLVITVQPYIYIYIYIYITVRLYKLTIDMTLHSCNGMTLHSCKGCVVNAVSSQEDEACQVDP